MFTSSYFFSSSLAISTSFFSSSFYSAGVTGVSAVPSAFCFLPTLALTFAVVLNTAVSTFSLFFPSSFFKNSGYLYSDGFACDTGSNDLGTFKFSLTPMSAVGVSESDMKFSRGYQYQC